MQQFKVGDYVQMVGIVYEDGTLPKSKGRMSIQMSNGSKVRGLVPANFEPVTPEAIASFKKLATDGLTPDEIIARELEETAKEEAEAKAYDEPEEEE